MSNVIIKTSAVCTWPADDVTIYQDIRFNTEGQEDKFISIGLSIDEIDNLIFELMAARQTAVDWNTSADEYFRKLRADDESA